MKGKLKCVYFSYYGSPGDVLNMNTSKVKENVLCLKSGNFVKK